MRRTPQQRLGIHPTTKPKRWASAPLTLCAVLTLPSGCGGEQSSATPSPSSDAGSPNTTPGSAAPNQPPTTTPPSGPVALPPAEGAVTQACDDRASRADFLERAVSLPDRDDDLATLVFDPAHVYLWGSAREQVCGAGTGAIATALDDPALAARGLPCFGRAVIHPMSGALIYADNAPPGPPTQIVPEAESDESAPWENDEAADAPADCMHSEFRAAPDGTILFRCGDSWSTAKGAAVFTGSSRRFDPARLGSNTLVHVGCRGQALLGNGVLDMMSEGISPFPEEFQFDVDARIDVLAVRATADGFVAAVDQSLYHIGFDGSVVVVGKYAAGVSEERGWALDAEGTLYQVETGSESNRVTAKRLGGTRVVTLDDADDIGVFILGNPLITGP